MNEDIKTTLITQVTRLDHRGQPQPVYRTEFDVGEQGPFSLEFTKAEFTAANVRDAQQKFAQTITDLISTP